MARVTEGVYRTTPWVLFGSSQIPLLVTLGILLAIPAFLGVTPPRLDLLAVGGSVLVLTALATLILPWERIPIPVQSILALADMAGITIIAVAMYGAIDHLSLIAAYPAVWLAIVGGVGGAAVGVAGTFAAAMIPVFVGGDSGDPAVWAAVVVVPLVVSVLVVVATVLTGYVRRSTDGLRRALEDVSSANAESTRIGSVMQTFAKQIDLGMAYVPVGEGEPFFNQALEHMSALAGIEGGAIGYATQVYAEDQVTHVPPSDQPLARMIRGESITDGLYWVGPRGRQRALLCNGQPVLTSEGVRAGSVIVVQDVTDLLRAERSRSDALATLAHELRTPLTSIVGYAELLAMEPLPPAAAERVDVITRNAEHLLRLTTDFLDGLQSPPELDREPAELRTILDAAIQMMETTPGFSERQVFVDVQPGLLVSVDGAAMSTVMSNLLTNAVKFSAPGDAIRITAGESAGTIWLMLHDSGPSIDTDDLERIFDRFYRGRLAQKQAIPGTGIGLSVSRAIVAAHAGTLTAEPVAEGACFRLTLPVDGGRPAGIRP